MRILKAIRGNSLAGTSLIAAATLAFASTAALAQDKPADEAGEEEAIVVTGTILRGVAPVGSSIISLNATDIQKTGLLTTTDILRSIPQISGIGTGEASTNTAANNANLNISRANALNIRGLGIQATLTLMNGRRLPVGGFGGQLFDPGSIPAIALARIDVVADGASATYGSDAVAGVANLILRTDVDGIEARARYGFADDYNSQALSMIAGKRWETGRAMIAAEYTWNDQLLQSDRPEFFPCDQTLIGGTNNCTFGGAPGNIVYTGAGAARFGLPAGSGVGVTAAQLSATPNRLQSYTFTTAIPGQQAAELRRQRPSGCVRYSHAVGGRLLLPPHRQCLHRPARHRSAGSAQHQSELRGDPRAAARRRRMSNIRSSTISATDVRSNRPKPGSSSPPGVDFKLGDNWNLARVVCLQRQLRRSEPHQRDQYRPDAAGARLHPARASASIPMVSGGSASNLAALENVLGFTNFKIWYDAHIVNGKIDGTLGQHRRRRHQGRGRRAISEREAAAPTTSRMPAPVGPAWPTSCPLPISARPARSPRSSPKSSCRWSAMAMPPAASRRSNSTWPAAMTITATSAAPPIPRSGSNGCRSPG